MAPPKKVVRGYGLMAREMPAFNPQTAEEIEEFRKAFSRIRSADAVRDENAQRMTGELSRAGSDPYDFDILLKFGEQAAFVTIAEWLRAYDRTSKIRSRIEAGEGKPGDIADLVEWAEKMGRLQERIWWRHGVDHDTGAKRESLAVTARESRKALTGGSAARDAHNAEVKANADQWKRIVCRMAKEIWDKPAASPLSAQAVAEIVRRKWPANLGAKKGNSTIRQAMREGGLKKPDRA